ncbi:synapse-associated protein 1 [Cystoisospora suis]|uniref:Synapse-associated protein 1 n=1 Tax=Cystoisospora suis TaxID=483139 RepID=A0A2C6L6A5_9APIC|nr:synapse-associated protein 1 [Cystoisospora suis]
MAERESFKTAVPSLQPMGEPASPSRVSSICGQDVCDVVVTPLRSPLSRNRTGQRLSPSACTPFGVARRSSEGCSSKDRHAHREEGGPGIHGGVMSIGRQDFSLDRTSETDSSLDATLYERSGGQTDSKVNCTVPGASERGIGQERSCSRHENPASKLPSRSRARGVGRESVAPPFHENNLKRFLSRERRESSSRATATDDTAVARNPRAPLATGLSRFFNSPVAAARAAAEAAQGHGNALLAALRVITGPTGGDSFEEENGGQEDERGKGEKGECEWPRDARGRPDMWVVDEGDLRRGASATPEESTPGRSRDVLDTKTEGAQTSSFSSPSSADEAPSQPETKVKQRIASPFSQRAPDDKQSVAGMRDPSDANKPGRRLGCNVEFQDSFKKTESSVSGESGKGSGTFSGFIETLSRGYTEAVNMVDALAIDFEAEERQVRQYSRRKSAAARRPTRAKGEDKGSTRSTHLESDGEQVSPLSRRSSVGSLPEGHNAEDHECTAGQSLVSFSSSRRPKPSFSVILSEDTDETKHLAVCSSSSSSLDRGSVSVRRDEEVRKVSKNRSFFSSVASAAGNALAEAGAMAGAIAAVAAAVVGESNSEDSSESSPRHAVRSGSRGKWESAQRNQHQLRSKKGARNTNSKEAASLSQSSFSLSEDAFGWEEGGAGQNVLEDTEGEGGGSLFLRENATPFEFALWATEDSEASLKRPLLSAPPAATSEHGEASAVVSHIDRREYVCLCRLRAVALRLLLLICQESSWCHGPSKKEHLITERDHKFFVGRPTWPRTGMECEDVGDFVDVQTEKKAEEEIENLWKEWTTGSSHSGATPEEGNRNRASRMRLMWKAAQRMLDVDGRLGRLRFDLVPRQLKELAFWKAYFYQVSLVMTRYERQAHELLRSLASSAPQRKNENDTRQGNFHRRGSSGSLLHLLTESSNSETSSSCSTPQYDTSPEGSSRVYIPPPSALHHAANASERGCTTLESGLCVGRGATNERIAEILDCSSCDPSVIATGRGDAASATRDREPSVTSPSEASSVSVAQSPSLTSSSVASSEVPPTWVKSTLQSAAGVPQVPCLGDSTHRERGTSVL